MSRRSPLFLPGGGALAAWLRSGPPSASGLRAVLWGYRWRGYWFDRSWRQQESLYPPQRFEGNGGRNLIFVLGFWRSGTTLLHELLAAGPRMAAPRTWQCMNPSGFRIAGAPRIRAPVSRPMDGVLVDALSPQEDEFALLARGAPSVYRVWLDPRRWEEALPALEQQTWLTLPESKWLVDWHAFLSWCMPEGAAQLVVKSPNHLFRLKALRRAWPNARLVWMLREPADMWHSNRKMWRAMTALYGIWEPRTEDLDRLLVKAMSEYAGTLRWAAKTLEDVVYVDFDRLATQTEHVLRGLTARLRMGSWESWRPLVERRLGESAKHRQQTYAGAPSLPADAAALVAGIRHQHRLLLQQEELT